MPKPQANAASELEPTYTIIVPPFKEWDKDNGNWKEPKFYSTPAWVKYGGRVIVLEGQATTKDILVALEFVDSGATVTPDPRPIWQERYARELEADAQTNPVRLWELRKYVLETNDWRGAHGFDPLSVEAPNVSRPVSGLMLATPMNQPV